MDRKYLGELGVPALPGGFLDVLTYFSRNDNPNNNDMGTIQMSELTNQVPPQIQQQGQAKISSGNNELYGNGSRPSGSTSSAKPTSNGKTVTQDKGKGKETPPVNPLNISGMSRMYVLAQIIAEPADIIEKDTSWQQRTNLPDPVIHVSPKSSKRNTMQGS
jgi:hypothetical protein